MALQWRRFTNGASPCSRLPHGIRSSARGTLRVTASFVNPHSILGVSPTADVKEVKRAYRKLALQYHPDVCKSEDGQERFVMLTQAYEALLGRAEGKTDPGHASASGWDFHDWYWNFRKHRSWEHQQRHASQGDDGGGGSGAGRPPPPHSHAGYKQSEGRANLRSQLAGLRHRAAVRAKRPASPSPAAAAAAATAPPSPPTTEAANPDPSGASPADRTSGRGSPRPRADAAAAAAPPESSAEAPRSWSWSWDWASGDEDSEDEGDNAPNAGVAGAAVGGTAAAAAAVAATEQRGDGMAMHDGHFGTALHVENHAVPFAGGLNATSKFQPTEPNDTHADADSNLQHHSVPDSEFQHHLDSEPEPEPFSNPFSHHPAAGYRYGGGSGGSGGGGQDSHHQGQYAGAARRRFAADSATRESVSHQLAGLRRKAAMKVAAMQDGAAGGGGSGSGV